MLKIIPYLYVFIFILSSCSYGDEKEIIEAFDNFKKNQSNTDSLLASIDKASYEHFWKILEISKKDNVNEIKSYIDNSDYPLTNYNSIFYTKYVYLELPSTPQNKDELLKKYLGFDRTNSSVLWGYSDDKFISGCNVSEVKFNNKNESIATLVCNILHDESEKKRYTLSADIPFRFEDNKWKIHIPATKSLIEDRIKISLVATRTNKKKYVRNLLEKTGMWSTDSVSLKKWKSIL